MPWLRLDDGFAAHPKIAALTDRELRVWLRVLCYCSRLSDPTVDSVTIREVPGLTLKVISKLIDLELLDKHGKDFEVHDWLIYQPKDATGADRQARWRARRNADRNGSRNADVDGPDRDENVTSRVGARAQPVPTRPVPVPIHEAFPPSDPDLDQDADAAGEGRTDYHEGDFKPDLTVLKDMPA